MAKVRGVKQQAPDPKEFIAQLSQVDSVEVYQYPDGTEQKVLRDISLDIRRGECWGLVGNEAFEIDLLLEIIGSVRPYGNGRCILAERGMMRKKRKVLPHVYFISDGDVTFPNMNTLEYLMFATANIPVSAAHRQEQILQRLLDTGLYYLTLVPIGELSRAQRVVISLFAASFSSSLLVIFSVSGLRFDSSLAQGIREVANIICAGGGAVLIGTGDLDMAQTACTHTAFLIGGRIDQQGSMEDMLSKLDKRMYIVSAQDAQGLSEKLKCLSPALNIQVRGQAAHVFDVRENPVTQAEFLELLTQSGETITALEASRKTLETAFEEALNSHDL